ncbi:hypothetical protein VDGE_04224 [Verticillium dahliae]|uniref:Nephrocystin 3-like N-terminal domain-containing protein n=1 Tax=Verticillium dahliae TaxID=27337 RepID=A0A444S339_VERDA|nr:hypothetical protein VDGE_04224 [Verticillium dahliae]
MGRLTWAWERDLSLFWPKEWLPLEPELGDARIFSFGYDANFTKSTQDTLNIKAFAEQLLNAMTFGRGEYEDWDIGKVPIIFVVHSMGGLVFKKAYNLGAIDEKFSAMTDTIRGVVFLATPHQGSNLADVLKKFLATFMQTPKQYINELRHNSEALVGINEQYVQHARNMHLASFRETQATSIRGIKTHRRRVIKDFVKLVTSKAAISISRRPSTVQSFESIRKRLSGLIDTPERYKADLERVSQLYVPGSCDWILDDLHFRGWLSDDSLEPSILKLSGSPGSGKSVMAGFLVTHLEEIQKNVQYFVFRYNEEAKRSIAVCLKMLAYQIALCMPEYRRKILPLLEDKNALARNDARGVWQRAFVNILAKMDLDEPLFWVIDAVDECESAQILLNLLPALKEQSIPVKIIFLTRPQASLSAFERLRYKFGSDFRQTEVVPTREGQKLFIEQELEGAYGEWPQNFVNNVKDDLLRKSKGNFLWLTLVTEELRRCATEKPLEEVLSQPPEDLVGVYSRIVNSIAKTYSEGELQTAKRILIWITCAESQLSLGELEEVLSPELTALNIKRTIHRLCGDLFLSVMMTPA